MGGWLGRLASVQAVAGDDPLARGVSGAGPFQRTLDAVIVPGPQGASELAFRPQLNALGSEPLAD
jgi:hypothetical protein